MAVGPVHGPLPLAQPRGLQELLPTEKVASAERPDEVTFADVFGHAIASANELGHASKAAALALAEGRSDDIHGTMIESQKSGIQMKLVGNMKNKVVDAFYEIWRMSI